ncbi:MAG: hypothetical protein BWY75_00642 [bacterium ADurb.Bin425]|nr:MAG: hypothetical protein BWY75_00642 [bacterium ADurb.Bin425]
MVKLGVSLMLEDNFFAAFLPLYRQGLVQCMEWSFDTGLESMPGWAFALLNDYGERGALLGHGVSYSLFSENARQTPWLQALSDSVESHRFTLFSEHFGFTQAGRYIDNAPLSVPFSQAFVERGRANLARLQQHAATRVGLENLAFAFSREDVLLQGAFLEALLQDQPQSFLLLDLHNLYCQATNFGIDALELLATYPLERVVEIHMAGGRVEPRLSRSSLDNLRRDTHDCPVPEELFDLLGHCLTVLPNLAYVIYERLGTAFVDESDRECFQNDYLRLADIVANAVSCQNVRGQNMPGQFESSLFESRFASSLYQDNAAVADAFLETLSEGLACGNNNLRSVLSQKFACYAPYIASMQTDMIDLAARLYKRWGVPLH